MLRWNFIEFFESAAVAQNSILGHWHLLEWIPFHRCLQPASINRNIYALWSDSCNLMPGLWSVLAPDSFRLLIVSVTIYRWSLDQCNCLLCLCNWLAYFGSFGPMCSPAAENSVAHMEVLSENKRNCLDFSWNEVTWLKHEDNLPPSHRVWYFVVAALRADHGLYEMILYDDVPFLVLTLVLDLYHHYYSHWCYCCCDAFLESESNEWNVIHFWTLLLISSYQHFPCRQIGWSSICDENILPASWVESPEASTDWGVGGADWKY